MGVPGLWDILRPAGQQRSLTHLAVVDGFEHNPAGRRGLRVGIDASIWFYHATYGREGENPELRTLFFRCARLMSRPFLPLFVFDGPSRPKLKRKKKVSGKDHWMVSGMQEIIEAFGFEYRTAPGEAEAELAYLNRIGVIDAIITDDVDTFLFGATMLIRNPGKLLTGNSAHPVRNTAGKDDGEHTYTYTSADIASHPDIALTQGGLILIGLLRGGDYDPEGLVNCGPTVAHALARSGFGDTLLDAARTLSRKQLPAFLGSWRAEIRTELRTNARGFLSTKKVALANALPDSFPDIDVLLLYTRPLTSELSSEPPTPALYKWAREPDLGKLAALCERKFEWGVREIIVKRFRTVIWAPAVLRILRHAVLDLDEAGPSTPRKKRPTDDADTDNDTRIPPGTPSSMIARHFSSRIGQEDDGSDDEHRLIVKIHSKRAHASTDGVPEYRLEIAPAQLVRLTEAGVQGTRPAPSKPADCGEGGSDFDDYDDDDDDDEDEGGKAAKKKKNGPKKPPAPPESHMRVWMPVSMVERVEPALVAAYEGRVARRGRAKEELAERRAARAAKASGSAGTKTKAKGKSTARKGGARRAADEEEEEEEEELSATEDFSDVFGLTGAAIGKGKGKATSRGAKTKRISILAEAEEEEEEEEEEEIATPKASKPKPKARPPLKSASSSFSSLLPSGGQSQSETGTSGKSNLKSKYKPPAKNSADTPVSSMPMLSKSPKRSVLLEMLNSQNQLSRASQKGASTSGITSTAASRVGSARVPAPFPMCRVSDEEEEEEEDFPTKLATGLPIAPSSPPRSSWAGPELKARAVRTKRTARPSSSDSERDFAFGRASAKVPPSPKKSPRRSKTQLSPIAATDAERPKKMVSKAKASTQGSVKPLLAAKAWRRGASASASTTTSTKQRKETSSSSSDLSDSGALGRAGSPSPVRPRVLIGLTRPNPVKPTLSSVAGPSAPRREYRASEIIELSSSSDSEGASTLTSVPAPPPTKPAKSTRIDSVFPMVKPRGVLGTGKVAEKNRTRKVNPALQPLLMDSDDVIDLT